MTGTGSLSPELNPSRRIRRPSPSHWGRSSHRIFPRPALRIRQVMRELLITAEAPFRAAYTLSVTVQTRVNPKPIAYLPTFHAGN